MSLIGQRIGSYRLVRPIGEGGMGVVYEAVHEQMGKRAAVKLLHAELSGDPAVAKRFLNEARAVSIIDNPGVVNIFEFGQREDGSAYIIMEFLAGETLYDRLEQRGGKVDMPAALRLVRQVASTLQAAHRQNIVHRDLKPENIMIVPDAEAPGGERAKILDFGIAKVAEEHQLKSTKKPLRTHTGMVMGTPVYIAPEQARGAREVTHKADVYSLGVVLYELLAGRPPFIAEGSGELLGMHIFQEPPQLRELMASVPEDVAALVHRLLTKDPEARPSMGDLITELEALGAPKASAALAVVSMDKGARGAARGDKVNPFSSTIGGASGQTQARTRRRAVVGAAAVAVSLAGGLGLVALLAARQHPGPAALPLKDQKPVAAALVMPVEKVRWSLTSTPDGAEIVRLEDGAVLGKTPYSLERPRGDGKLGLALRKQGFVEERIDLDLSSDVTRQIALQTSAAPVPAAAVPAPKNKEPVRKKVLPAKAAAAPVRPAKVETTPTKEEASPPKQPPKRHGGMEDFEKGGGP